MRKNAFTLIELLAVIVILAIIALIAVPIVVNIINDSKNSSDEQTVELYLDTVKKSITREQLSNSSFNPTDCIIQEDGNLVCNNVKINVDMKGLKPNGGTIIIFNDKINYRDIVLNDKKYTNMDPICKSVSGIVSLNIGTKYECNVNNKDKFNFYVLSVEDEYINLMMDRNLCEDGTVSYTEENNYCRYAWHEDEYTSYYGPDTALSKLYAGTKNWSNVPIMELDYEDEATGDPNGNYYTKLIIKHGKGTLISKYGNKTSIMLDQNKPIKARLAESNEMIGAGCKYNHYSLCKAWTVNALKDASSWMHGLYSENEHIEYIYGYWLLSSPAYSISNSITYPGMFETVNTTNSTKIGVRPVITVSIADLE